MTVIELRDLSKEAFNENRNMSIQRERACIKPVNIYKTYKIPYRLWCRLTGLKIFNSRHVSCVLNSRGEKSLEGG